MAYKPPESKREGCHYPNCSGYLEVPFCCHDPESFPALKAKLAQIKTPKQWVGLTIDESSDLYNKNYDLYATDMPIGDFIMIQREVEAKLKEKNGG